MIFGRTILQLPHLFEIRTSTMTSLVRPFLTSILCCVFAFGHVPAWMHVATCDDHCGHASIESDACSSDVVHSCGCGSHGCDTVAADDEKPEQRPTHDSDICHICLSLAAPSGVVDHDGPDLVFDAVCELSVCRSTTPAYAQPAMRARPAAFTDHATVGDLQAGAARNQWHRARDSPSPWIIEMNALLELIYSTPGIEDSDEIVLELPRKLCLQFGDECYRVISDQLLAEQDITRSEKLKTVLEQLPRYTDGVSTTFLAWCGENFAALAEVPSNLHSAVCACLECESSWKDTEYHLSVSKLASSIIESKSDSISVSDRQLASWRLKRLRQQAEAEQMLASGAIVIGDPVLAELIQNDNVAERQVGFQELESSIIRNCFAGYLIKEPTQRLDDNLVRSSFEVCSFVSADRFMIDAEWRLRDQTYSLEAGYWGGQLNERRRALWSAK